MITGVSGPGGLGEKCLVLDIMIIVDCLSMYCMKLKKNSQSNDPYHQPSEPDNAHVVSSASKNVVSSRDAMNRNASEHRTLSALNPAERNSSNANKRLAKLESGCMQNHHEKANP